ncbi:hypothetical protein L228DRAFT_21885 [Xylona heveae TC161]|uniref:Uncharacterized protein n=1 Tax=Xylona heveae (strain CBS 132557 / TC161) TaxID=1328760 RepID=A0A165K310_XYLHT|nr:hypothetical protein L228DRAFT_21885 [Xylona heveae TC161]KZF26929.1 hypothetical protein L228DRAFT_21885 [Xylona heveae TC161]
MNDFKRSSMPCRHSNIIRTYFGQVYQLVGLKPSPLVSKIRDTLGVDIGEAGVGSASVAKRTAFLASLLPIPVVIVPPYAGYDSRDAVSIKPRNMILLHDKSHYEIDGTENSMYQFQIKATSVSARSSRVGTNHDSFDLDNEKYR